MASESRHIAVHVERPVDEVYTYASDPSHLPGGRPACAPRSHPSTTTGSRSPGWARSSFATPSPTRTVWLLPVGGGVRRVVGGG